VAQRFGTGYLGVAAIVGAECLALLLCLPGYSTCEYAAGALFGAPIGVAACSTAKILAATISWVTIRTLKDSPAGRWAQERVAGSGQAGGGFMHRLKAGVEGNSFRFCLMVRCSPLPAWLSNYALPLSGLPFSIYMPASLIGMLPPIATNVYAGAAAASVASVISGGEGTGFGVMGMVALGISVLSSTMLVHQLSTTNLEDSSSSSVETPGQSPTAAASQ